MIIIDECVSQRLKKSLEKVLDETILAIGKSEYAGKSDDFIMGLGVATESILITRDYKFYSIYPLKKIYYTNQGWKKIYETIIELRE